MQEAKVKPSDNIINEEKMVEEMQGTNQSKGTEVIAARSKKVYYARPCSFDMIPQLSKYINVIDSMLTKNDNTADLFVKEEGKLITAMKGIIKMAFDDQISEEDIGKEFSLGDFPKIYQIALDINDFLAGMRAIYNI